MNRSPAARAGIGRPLGSTGSRGGARGSRVRIGRWRGRRSGSAERPWSRSLQTLTGLARGGLAFVADHRRLRTTLVSVLVGLPLLAGGWLLLRDSPLVSVERVQISGVYGPESAAIEAALTRAARHMSTLDVHPAALTAAVAPYRVVREVHTSSSFPHDLKIRVVEQLPVAALTVAGVRTAVAADGVILGPALLSGSLPTVDVESARATIGRLPGQAVRGSSLLASLAVLGAAPARMAGALTRVFSGPEGVTVVMANKLVVYFGDAARPHAKWLSLARVLADPSSAGASYVDVRLPERPAAGLPGGAAGQTSTTAGEPASASEPGTAAELAAGLTAALGGKTVPASPATAQPSPGAAPAETTASEPGESRSAPSSGAQTGATSAPPSEEQSATAAPGG